ncbi:UTP--glucose-1-phosphate uridylyltransferase [Miltoncostaea marina]|uniref:UTP--glucose-1-phosphate uridylyltransferase n=1 Tax=Miltoncostaea marina TaxID=2843215 RepID=UPI001C3C52C7|nr:UDPGP type 1 family protein [Miltoncostaea marina]
MTSRARLAAAGQEHLADRLERLDGEARARLQAEIDALDLDLIGRLVGELVGDGAPPHEGAIEPPDPDGLVALPRDDGDVVRDARAREAGEELLRSGAMAAVLLAGGQGTRLGFEGPKGLFPFAPITGRVLFEHHAAKIAAVRKRYGAALPWYILTSPQNDAVTREAFREAGWYGLPPESVRFVVQGTLPAVDRATGRILLEAPDRLALSPNGHGGLLSALRDAGALDEMAREGVRTMFTFQVDNPLVRVCRPELLGHHFLGAADMSSVVVRKVGPEEKMGVIARVDGRTGVVEYSDLSPEMAAERDDRGELVLWAGSIAVHCVDVAFARRLTDGGLQLPYHRAVKKVPYVAEDGAPVEPDAPNAVKFETFLFDALPAAERTVTVEAAREDEFSPIKNAEGADSPATARRDLNRLYARWLADAGVMVPRDAAGEPVDLEIDPRRALDPHELAASLPPGFTVDGPTVIGPPG